MQLQVHAVNHRHSRGKQAEPGKLATPRTTSHGVTPANRMDVTGVLIPLVKDKAGDLSSVDNYRPITISLTLSKVFEHVLLSVFGNYLISDELVWI